MSLTSVLIIIAALFAGPPGTEDLFTLGSEILTRETTLTSEWLYRAGDNPRWAEAAYDDSGWPVANTSFFPNNPPAGWNGVGWFRLHIDIEPELVGHPLVLRYGRSGKLDLYIDGEHVASAEQDDEWNIVSFTRPGEYILAVRYRLELPAIPLSGDWDVGFHINIGPADEIVAQAFDYYRGNTFVQVLFSAIPLAFALLHFVLFLFMRQTRSNAWYALLLVLWSAGVFLDYQAEFTNGMAGIIAMLRLHRATMVAVALVSLRFVYSVFLTRLPRRFWFFCIFILAGGVPIILWPIGQMFQLFIILQVVVIAEQFRVIINAIRCGESAAWLFLVGMIFVTAFGAYDALLDLDLLQPINGITNAYYFGHLGMFVCMTIYLARSFARSLRQRREEEVRRLVVESESHRKTQEIDEARELQLAMLPRSFPDVPDYDIAVRMRTATEVGGDYYGGAMRSDGWFNFGIGDATGHGLRAGFMTFLFKILFENQDMERDLRKFMRHGNEMLSNLKLRGVRAALLTVMLKGPQLTACSAGIPPFYLHRSADNTVDEILIPGMMLGSSLDFPFEQRQIQVEPGDTLLFMTDGLPELLNEDAVEFGYDRVMRHFGEVAHFSPEAILDEMYSAADNWAAGQAWGDDITLMAFRYRG